MWWYGQLTNTHRQACGFPRHKFYDNSHCWSIAHLRWNKKEPCFEFESVGTRYLVYRKEGLEEWLLKWCELKKIEYNHEECNY